MKTSSNVPAGIPDGRQILRGSSRTGFSPRLLSVRFLSNVSNKQRAALPSSLQRSRSSSTHATIHINQTSALYHNVYPALELWISTALWLETLSCKQIIKTLRRLLLSEAQQPRQTDFSLIPAMRLDDFDLLFESQRLLSRIQTLGSAVVFCTDFFVYSVFLVSGKCFQVLLRLLLSNYWSSSFLFTLNRSAKQSYKWLWLNISCSTLTCCLNRRH